MVTLTIYKTFKNITIGDFLKSCFFTLILLIPLSLVYYIFFNEPNTLSNFIHISIYLLLSIILLIKLEVNKYNINYLFKDLKTKVNAKDLLLAITLNFLISSSLILILIFFIIFFKIDFLYKFNSSTSFITYISMFITFVPLLQVLILIPVLLKNILIKSKNWFNPNISRKKILWFAIIFSSILCTLLFFNINALGLLIFEICNCILYCKHNNIIITLISHTLYNILISIFAFSLSTCEVYLYSNENLLVFIFAIGVIISLVSIYSFTKWICKYKSYIS